MKLCHNSLTMSWQSSKMCYDIYVKHANLFILFVLYCYGDFIFFSVYPAFRLAPFGYGQGDINTTLSPEGYLTVFPTGSFEGQSVANLGPLAPYDIIRAGNIRNFPSRAFSIDIEFSQFNIGNTDNCQGNEILEDSFLIQTAPAPSTFDWKCVGRNTLPAPMEFQLQPDDYEVRFTLKTQDAMSPSSVALAIKYKGRLVYNFKKKYISIVSWNQIFTHYLIFFNDI